MTPGQKLIAKKDFKHNLTEGKDYGAGAIFHDDETFCILDDMGHEFTCHLSEIADYFTDTPSFGTWQPIETAPKDGTYIILYTKPWIRPQIGFFSAICDCWYNQLAFYYQPTHWMPLPELPKQ